MRMVDGPYDQRSSKLRCSNLQECTCRTGRVRTSKSQDPTPTTPVICKNIWSPNRPQVTASVTNVTSEVSVQWKGLRWGWISLKKAKKTQQVCYVYSVPSCDVATANDDLIIGDGPYSVKLSCDLRPVSSFRGWGRFCASWDSRRLASVSRNISATFIVTLVSILDFITFLNCTHFYKVALYVYHWHL